MISFNFKVADEHFLYSTYRVQQKSQKQQQAIQDELLETTKALDSELEALDALSLAKKNPDCRLNSIVVGLFDSPILVGGGGQKSPSYLTLDW